MAPKKPPSKPPKASKASKPSKPPKPSKPSNPTPKASTSLDNNEPRCEFTNPCTTGTDTSNGNGSTTSTASHPRKVISHIFGRNKTSTKLFPRQVWIHYCRKHYQRARYRSRAWPFTQCDLLLDSLKRMERWGGVESFELVLRRREVERLASGNKDVDVDDVEETTDDDGKKKKKGKGKKKGRKKPRITPCPVPEWLRVETGVDKSFAEVREVVTRIRADLVQRKKDGEADGQVVFPDIEILPKFRAWVLEKAARGREEEKAKKKEEKKKVSRVSVKGAVQKTRG